MDTFLAVVSFLVANGTAIVASVVALLAALAAVFMFIPGDQPEKTLKAIAAFLEKFSAK